MAGGHQLLREFHARVVLVLKALKKKPIIWEDLFDYGVAVTKEPLVQFWQCWSIVSFICRSKLFLHITEPMSHWRCNPSRLQSDSVDVLLP